MRFIRLHSRQKGNNPSSVSAQGAIAETRVKRDVSHHVLPISLAQVRRGVKGKYGFLTLLGALALLTYFASTIDRLPGDLAIVLWMQGLADPEKLGPIPDLLFWMGVMGVAGALIVAACGWLWLRGHRTEAVFLALVGIPDLINAPLRDLIGRPRPTIELVQVFGGPQGASFPSGYTLHVLLFCGFILYLSRYLVKRRAFRYILWAVLGLYIPVTGIWLILDGRHWPSDVLGGYVYGAFYLVLLIWGYKKYTAWRRRYGAHELPVRSRPLVWVLKLVD